MNSRARGTPGPPGAPGADVQSQLSSRGRTTVAMSQNCPSLRIGQTTPMTSRSLRGEPNGLASASREARRSQPRAASHGVTSNCLTPYYKADGKFLHSSSTKGLGKIQSLTSPDQSDLSSQAPPLRSVVRISGSCFAAARQDMDRYFVSVDTRLLLKTPERSLNPFRVGKFLGAVADRYNQGVGSDYPQMQWKPIVLGEDYARFGNDGGKWNLMDDTMRGGGCL